MKKNFLRLLSILMLLALLLGTAACSSDDSNSSSDQSDSSPEGKGDNTNPETIKVWLPPFGTEDSLDYEVWGDIFKSFEEENKTKVELEIISWDVYPDKYLTGVSSGKGPDIGYMYADMFPDFIQMGVVEDMSPYITDKDREHFFYLDEGYIMGKQYGFPIIVGNPRITYYNKKLLADANVQPPKTWDEFVDACKKTTKDTDNDGKIDQWGFMQPWGDKMYGVIQQNFNPWLLSAGGTLYNEDGTKATFGSDAGVKAAQFIHDLLHVHKVMPNTVTGSSEQEAMEMFKSGKVAFLPASTSASVNFKSVPDLEWGYVIAFEDECAKTMMVADHLTLMSSAEDKEFAMKLIRHMLKGENMAKFHKMAPFPPVAGDEEYSDDPAFKDIYDNQRHMLQTEKPTKGAFKVNEYLYKNLQLMMMGELTPEEAVKKAEEYANQILSE